MSQADFALQWLHALGHKVYNNGQQILVYKGYPVYEISPLDTKIKKGEKLGEDEELKPMFISYPDLITRGFIVISDSSVTWRKNQKCHYRISRKQINSIGISPQSFTSAKLQIQHDPVNRKVRLIGENSLAAEDLRLDSGVGPWIVYDADAPIATQYKKKKVSMTKEQFRASFTRTVRGDDDDTYQKIEELPVMISDEKKIVCFPKKDFECQRIIAVGESGTGKSELTNAVGGRLLYKFQDRVIWMEDTSNQYEDISLPQDYDEFIKKNRLINDAPKPIPAVQCYMACNRIINMKHPNISLLITLSFIEFLNKFEFYSYGVKDWNFADKLSYLMDFKNDIKNLSTSKEIMKVMYDKIPNVKGEKGDQGMKRMIYKWVNKFDSILTEKFISTTHKGNSIATDELEVRFADGRIMKGHPMIMLAEAGLVPVFNVHEAMGSKWFRNYLADFMQKIMEHQDNMKEKRKRIWLIYDEMNEIYQFGKNKDNAYFAFEKTSSQGRYKGLGFFGNTQSIDKVNPDIWMQATQICCFYMKDDGERRKIAKNFVEKAEVNSIVEQIGTLKKHEFIMFTNPGINPLITYDRWGRKETSDRKWFKGIVIPPPNHHSVMLKQSQEKKEEE